MKKSLFMALLLIVLIGCDSEIEKQHNATEQLKQDVSLKKSLHINIIDICKWFRNFLRVFIDDL